MTDTSENTRNFYRNQGAEAERERIIKLLEEFAKNYRGDKEEMELWFPDDYFGVWIVPELIALIKGKNK